MLNVTSFACRKQKRKSLIIHFSGKSVLGILMLLTLPSMGASGGILIAWNSGLFNGTKIFSNNFAVTMIFSSRHDNSSWTLTCVYAPCTPEGRTLFLNWFQEITMPIENNWLILGDFNLIRKLEDRNKPGGDLNDIFNFNAAISQLGIVEIALRGRKYTWSNMQPSPLLDRLDFYLKLLD